MERRIHFQKGEVLKTYFEGFEPQNPSKQLFESSNSVNQVLQKNSHILRIHLAHVRRDGGDFFDADLDDSLERNERS